MLPHLRLSVSFSFSYTRAIFFFRLAFSLTSVSFLLYLLSCGSQARHVCHKTFALRSSLSIPVNAPRTQSVLRRRNLSLDHSSWRLPQRNDCRTYFYFALGLQRSIDSPLIVLDMTLHMPCVLVSVRCWMPSSKSRLRHPRTISDTILNEWLLRQKTYPLQVYGVYQVINDSSLYDFFFVDTAEWLSLLFWIF